MRAYSPSLRLPIALLFLFPFTLAAQKTNPPAPSEPSVVKQQTSEKSTSGSTATTKAGTTPAQDSSQESVIVESSVTKVKYEADGTGTREAALALRVQSQAGVQALGILSFSYLSSNETVEFDYIRVRKPDGTVVNTPDYNVQDMPAEVTRAAPMYSDTREKQVTVKALGVGDILEYSVRFRVFKPQVLGQFWWDYKFDKSLIYRNAELQLTLPKDKYLNLSSPDYKPEIKEDGNFRTYTWRSSNLKPVGRDTPVSQEAQKPDVQFSTFHSWQEVGAWYNELQKPQLTVTPQLQAKAAELTHGLTGREERIRALYNYVSTHFHYVSLSFGVGRYQPHPAEDVLENEYGDCKDKHTLLATLLKAEGIEAWPALINSGRKLDPSMPSPGQFDHVITYVPQPGSPLWLDTTPGVAPFGLLLTPLRDKQALVIPSDRPAELMTTPANPPFPIQQSFTMDASIDSGGTLKGHVQQIVRGDNEVYLRLAFRATAEAQWKDLAQRIVATEGFGGEVSNVAASSPDDTTKPFEFSYDYTRKSYSDWDEHRIIAPLPVTGLEGAAVQEKKPPDPVELGGLGELVFTANVKLPVDVEKLPADVSLQEPYADYSARYSHVGSVLLMTRRLKIKENEVPLASWDNYKKFSKALSDDWGAYTELYAAAAGTEAQQQEKTGALTTQKTPAELLEKGQQVNAALDRNDTTTAEELLLELLKKYPDQKGLHSTLGYVYTRQGNSSSAIEEFQKEEQLHPENGYTYSVLAAYYIYLHRDDSAAEQYRKWIELDPKNYDAYAGLGAVLARQKKYPEMLTMWQSAAKELPDNSHVKSALGMSYLRNKQPDKGVPFIEQGLTADSKPMDFNDASYELADANVDLPKAKEWGEKAIADLYKESLSTTSEEAALNNTRFIGMTWDTVGWVYFQMGQYDKAVDYLRSAFSLSQAALIGEHLAQTYQKQGQKQLAARTYKLAYAGTNSDSTLKDEIMDRHNKLMGPQADVAMLGPTHNKDGTITPGPAEELSRARTTHIAAQSPAKASATFSIVFSPGKIEDVKFIIGDEKLKPMTTQIASSKLRAEFPDSTPARLTRRGLLLCGQAGCDLTLLLPDTPYATESQH